MKKRLYFLIALTALCLCGCKYSEGPGISFRTPEERIVGYWKLADVYKNGEQVDSTAVFPYNPGSYYAFFIERMVSVTAIRDGIMYESEYGGWDFQNKNKELYIMFKMRFKKYEYVAEIKRLTLDELVYEFYDDNGDKWRFEFDSRSSQYY